MKTHKLSTFFPSEHEGVNDGDVEMWDNKEDRTDIVFQPPTDTHAVYETHAVDIDNIYISIRFSNSRNLPLVETEIKIADRKDPPPRPPEATSTT